MKNFVLSIAASSLLLTGCSESKKKESEKDPAAQEAATPEKNTSDQKENAMYKELSKYIQSAEAEMEAIPSERKEELKKIADFVKTRKDSNKTANLTFICTHNSRRSHMSQIWAAAAAAHYGIEENVNTYSGGTEATAFNPRAVAAIERAGFQVVNPGVDNPLYNNNPHYEVTYASNGKILECFSKKYDDPFNANEHFAAIMTCSEADEACPFIPGADLRVPIPYVDPKESDGTDKEAATYDERCKQIATEMLYMMSQVEA